MERPRRSIVVEDLDCSRPVRLLVIAGDRFGVSYSCRFFFGWLRPDLFSRDRNNSTVFPCVQVLLFITVDRGTLDILFVELFSSLGFIFEVWASHSSRDMRKCRWRSMRNWRSLAWPSSLARFTTPMPTTLQSWSCHLMRPDDQRWLNQAGLAFSPWARGGRLLELVAFQSVWLERLVPDVVGSPKDRKKSTKPYRKALRTARQAA